MTDRLSGCGCCGCDSRGFDLYPDIYEVHDLRCFRTVVDTTIVTTTTTVQRFIYEDNVLVDSPAEESIDVDAADPTPRTTTVPLTVYGTFRYDYDGMQSVIESSLEVVEGSKPSGNYTEEQTTITVVVTGELTIRFRLAVRFDVSDQFLFGDLAPSGDAQIVSSHLRTTRETHLPMEFQAKVPIGDDGQPVFNYDPSFFFPYDQGSIHGFLYDSELPQTIVDFDQQVSNSPHNETFPTTPTHYVDVKMWLPSSDHQTLTVLFDSAVDGAKLTVLRMAIADRENPNPLAEPEWYSGVNRLYDWRRHFRRTAEFTFESKFAPKDNYQIDMVDLVGKNSNPDHVHHWNDEDSELTIALFASTDIVSQTYSMEVEDTPGSSPASVNWMLVSDGAQFGSLVHALQTSPKNNPQGFVFDQDIDGPVIRVRDSVIEIGRSITREEGDVTAYYQFVPFYPQYAGDVVPQMQLRVSMPPTEKRFWTVRYNQLAHTENQKNLKCPPNETCGLIADYAHAQWRISNISMGGLTGKPVDTILHVGCNATITSEPISSQVALKTKLYRKQKFFSDYRTRDDVALWTAMFAANPQYHCQSPTAYRVFGGWRGAGPTATVPFFRPVEWISEFWASNFEIEILDDPGILPEFQYVADVTVEADGSDNLRITCSILVSFYGFAEEESVTCIIAIPAVAFSYFVPLDESFVYVNGSVGDTFFSNGVEPIDCFNLSLPDYSVPSPIDSATRSPSLIPFTVFLCTEWDVNSVHNLFTGETFNMYRQAPLGDPGPPTEEFEHKVYAKSSTEYFCESNEFLIDFENQSSAAQTVGGVNFVLASTRTFNVVYEKVLPKSDVQSFPELTFASEDIVEINGVARAKAIVNRTIEIQNRHIEPVFPTEPVTDGFWPAYDMKYDKLKICYETQIVDVTELTFSLSLLNSDTPADP